MIVSSPSSLTYPEVPAGSILAGTAARWPDRVALHADGAELTFGELYRKACAFANALHGAGVSRGDVVAVHLANRLEYAIAYHGILLSGATYTPANPLLPPADLAAQLIDSGAVLAVSFDPASKALAAVRAQTAVRQVVLVGSDGEDGFDRFIADAPTTRPDVEIDIHDDLAHLAYTGGTTGRSKGVRIPHRNVVVNALQYACWGSGGEPRVDADGGVWVEQVGDEAEYPNQVGTGVTINLTPWFHAMGTVGSLNIALLAGTTQVLHERFDPGRYLADGEKFGITSMTGAPPLFAALIAHPDFATRNLSEVRGITSGAAPLAVELINVMRARFGEDVPVTEGYGLTEVTMGATSGPAARSAVRKIGTVGLPVPDTQIKLVGEDGSEQPLPVGEAGEVCIKGPQVMLGYLNRPEETEATLVDGWLHTGDIGVLDDEGYLSIVDRKKDMLLYKGYNVYPRQLEELLFARPGVRAAAVVGKPDPATGELPVAFVIPERSEGFDAEQLRTEVNARLLPYQHIREIHLTDALPVSAAGKVLKRELRERLR
ncbi:class I adenylate-forming enzyme family protein [Pseudonocardia spinosispora]|uniref:class I adenylate-forming enzyme family protein n=1 Tax=Pseudonocardia spinosispora TaxID=103441 RepID=UPI000404CEF5|nr:AMP-binding protein [Pseudonocardia spinosispora]